MDLVGPMDLVGAELFTIMVRSPHRNQPPLARQGIPHSAFQKKEVAEVSFDHLFLIFRPDSLPSWESQLSGLSCIRIQREQPHPSRNRRHSRCHNRRRSSRHRSHRRSRCRSRTAGRELETASRERDQQLVVRCQDRRSSRRHKHMGHSRRSKERSRRLPVLVLRRSEERKRCRCKELASKLACST